MAAKNKKHSSSREKEALKAQFKTYRNVASVQDDVKEIVKKSKPKTDTITLPLREIKIDLIKTIFYVIFVGFVLAYIKYQELESYFSIYK